ncbi:hypothetical protein CHI12_02615 [Terribacillus saccharophilus]|uniref:Uncharacterized protein n=1 Tax=Terribacillus saccharophilus TaxID=361277 RepID=A0A268HH46_9BACI|nr:hypothetical protein [Terribacillus saccharophilus]PAE09201.1 hypothetical protein CHI12_02615 [Terribacillus saccharophilus]
MPAKNQQNVMLQPPEMVSEKDLLYLSDMLNWNLNAAKKAQHAAGEVQLTDAQEALHTIGQMHQRHYDMLLEHLKTKPLN